MTKKDYKVLALINARGGSKRIPKKNIQLLNGKPLIWYAIQAGLNSSYVDRVVVSTEDDEIARIAKECGAEVPFKRPIELAGDNVTQFPPTEHALLELKKQGWSADIVVLVMANTPLTQGKDIDRVIDTLITSDADSVRSVCEVDTPPFWMYNLDEDNILSLFVKNVEMEDPNNCIRQNLPKVYTIAGVADAFWTKTVMNTKSLFGKKVKGCIFERGKSVDIDTPLDLLMVKTIMETREK